AEETALRSSDQPCLGLGLSEAIRAAVGGKFNTDRIDLVVCDLNGEVYRSEEWAAALPKCVTVSPKEFKLWHPADCMGDVGGGAGRGRHSGAARGGSAGGGHAAAGGAGVRVVGSLPAGGGPAGAAAVRGFFTEPPLAA